MLVRLSGRVYEAGAAAIGRRPRRELYHSALKVMVDDTTTTVEMAPVWTTSGDRGVIAEGPVGAPMLGRSRLFRYEIRCWRGGTIPDVAAAVGGPHTLTNDAVKAEALLDLVPQFPVLTWGRDELHMGDMWNSNSLISWLLARSELLTSDVAPPSGGRAPGWAAGLAAAARSM
jgi:hypothetical protein